MKKGYAYILFSHRKGTLYVGVTSDLKRRVSEHKGKVKPGFTEKYDVDKLGYYEEYPSIRDAIEREKKLKHLYRSEKLKLIESSNPNWGDLFYNLF
ncbi:GIY-YIG nuclease family protein [Fibrobacter succinogenes]|uniref:GIY-YIG nuclease family protein n=1 Tax=Fibrobacter succinogenes TaxID=833 RepID=UPI001568BFBF|nr:GIY-YIG nuclease family protein [Fibrobacter succinogenes]